MTLKKIRKERLSIYLARNSSKPDPDLIKFENVRSSVSLDIAGAESSTLYIKRPPPQNPPPWTRIFVSSGQVGSELFGASSSVGAVLIIRVHGRTFLISFGNGFHLIKNDSIERDFGLKVTLNSVDPDKLRSLDKATYDHNPLNSRTQSTREVDIFNLHVDSETDMLYAITGTSKVSMLGTQVTGRDSLTLSVETDLDGIPNILKEAANRYQSALPYRFSWVENINRVRDIDEIQILDLELDKHLTEKNVNEFWLGEPEVIDWENQIGYSFDLNSKTPRHLVLDFYDYIRYLDGRSLNVDSLKNDVVHINNSEYKSIKSWSVYRCLYAEVPFDGKQYILRNGIWYKVDNDFVKAVDDYISSISIYSYSFPTYNHDREEDYNSYVIGADSDFFLMDKKNIRIGGPYDKLEHCDLIKGGHDFVHVKFYRSSSSLSHLFSQGSVAAEAFIKDELYRERLNPKLPDTMKLIDPKKRPSSKSYKVVYAIATNKDIPYELPFFSKVTLKNAIKNLRALDYGVELAKIDVDPTLLLRKKYKPGSKIIN